MKKFIKSVIVDNGIYQYFNIEDKYKPVYSIEYHEPLREGDKHYVDVKVDGIITRYFNIVSLTLIKEEK